MDNIHWICNCHWKQTVKQNCVGFLFQITASAMATTTQPVARTSEPILTTTMTTDQVSDTQPSVTTKDQVSDAQDITTVANTSDSEKSNKSESFNYCHPNYPDLIVGKYLCEIEKPQNLFAANLSQHTAEWFKNKVYTF